MAELQSAVLGARPDFWQSYEKSKSQVLARAKPLAGSKALFPANKKEIDSALKAAGHVPIGVGYIPMAGRQTFWTVLVDFRIAEVLTFVPIDSF